MTNKTPSNPLGQDSVDMNTVIGQKIYDLVCTVSVLGNSQEKSMMLTKLDELRHWNEDDRRMRA